jgi:hypothetical protein
VHAPHVEHYQGAGDVAVHLHAAAQHLPCSSPGQSVEQRGYLCLVPCRREVDGQSTLLGFVGTPWTLAAYAMEGKADRDCKQTKVWTGREWGEGD